MNAWDGLSSSASSCSALPLTRLRVRRSFVWVKHGGFSRHEMLDPWCAQAGNSLPLMTAAGIAAPVDTCLTTPKRPCFYDQEDIPAMAISEKSSPCLIPTQSNH